MTTNKTENKYRGPDTSQPIVTIYGSKERTRLQLQRVPYNTSVSALINFWENSNYYQQSSVYRPLSGAAAATTTRPVSLKNWASNNNRGGVGFDFRAYLAQKLIRKSRRGGSGGGGSKTKTKHTHKSVIYSGGGGSGSHLIAQRTRTTLQREKSKLKIVKRATAAKQQVVLVPSPSLRSLETKTTIGGQLRAIAPGINYLKDPKLRLEGCIPDVDEVCRYLETQGAKAKNIYKLTDSPDNPVQPTYHNIVEGFKFVLRSAEPQDTVVWYYSGHGTNIADTSGTEADGKTEAIVPVNLELITDNLFHLIYDQCLSGKPTVRLWCFFDSCHSGTMLNAEYQYIVNSDITNISLAKGSSAYASKAQVVGFSGCLDGEVSEDGVNHGAFTQAFFTALEINRQKQISWGEFFLTLNRELRAKDHKQRSELSSTFPLDLTSPFVFP